MDCSDSERLGIRVRYLHRLLTTVELHCGLLPDVCGLRHRGQHLHAFVVRRHFPTVRNVHVRW